MRKLTLNELTLISGARFNNYYSNAFIAGMKGEEMIYSPLFDFGIFVGAFTGAMFGLIRENILSVALSSMCGAGLGALIAVGIVNYEYNAGANYAEVVKFTINS